MRSTIAFGFLAAALAAAPMGSVKAAVYGAVVPDDFPTVQQALDALTKTSSTTLRIRPGVYDGPVMVTGFNSLTITADRGAKIVARGTEPALTVCASGSVSISGLAIESQSVGLFVNSVGRVIAKGLDIDAGSHGVRAESLMPLADLIAMFGGVHDQPGGVRISAINLELLLTDSTVTSLHGDAVRVGPIESVAIGTATLVAPEGDGIHAEGAGGRVEVAQTTIDRAGDDGIEVTGKTLQMNAGNTISDPAGDGVTLGAGAVGTIFGGSIRYCGDSGVETHDGGTIDTIAGAAINGTQGDGIRADARRIASCTVTETGGDGIVVTGDPLDGPTGGAVTGNRVERIAGDGITSGAEGIAITENVVSDTGGVGIVADADSSSVGSNTVKHTGGDGIVAVGDHVQVYDNDVASPAGDGVSASGVDVSVTDNTVDLAGDAGVRVAAEGAYVSRNDVASPAGDGVVVAGGWSEVSGHTVTGAGGDGICILGAPARTGSDIRENVVEGAAADGIDLGEVSGARLSVNEITACGECGIRLGDGAKRNRLTGNSAQESGAYDLYESDASRKNHVARSNRFRTRHRRGQ